MEAIRSSKEELGVGPKTDPCTESASSARTPGLGTVSVGEGMPMEAGGVAVGVVLLLLFRM